MKWWWFENTHYPMGLVLPSSHVCLRLTWEPIRLNRFKEGTVASGCVETMLCPTVLHLPAVCLERATQARPSSSSSSSLSTGFVVCRGCLLHASPFFLHLSPGALDYPLESRWVWARLLYLVSLSAVQMLLPSLCSVLCYSACLVYCYIFFKKEYYQREHLAQPLWGSITSLLGIPLQAPWPPLGCVKKTLSDLEEQITLREGLKPGPYPLQDWSSFQAEGRDCFLGSGG